MSNRSISNPESRPAWLTAQYSAFVDHGLELVAPLSTDAWARAARANPAIGTLHTFGREDAAAVVVGNTRTMWPRFIEALVADPGARNTPDPLDRMVDRWLAEVVDTAPVAAVVHPAWRTDDGRVSMLRAAALAGLAHTGPAHLAVHPTFGPWFAIRAVVVYDAPAPRGSGPATGAAIPCDGCSAPCVDAMRGASASGLAPDAADVAARWDTWVAVRDACPEGRAWRYSDPQVRYHYTRDERVLASAIRASRHPS